MTNPLTQIPPKVRLIAYYVYAVVSLVGIYLVAKHLIGADEIALWSGIGGLFGLTAATHTPKPVKGARRSEVGAVDALYLAVLVLVVLAILFFLGVLHG